MGDGGLARLPRRDAGAGATFGQGVAEPVGVVAPIAQHGAGPGDRGQERASPGVVGHMARGEEQADRAAPGVGQGMELGVQAALGASDEAGVPPF